jgi:hypothetical protein
MDGVFAAKLTLSFIAGSLWITLVTIAAERRGTQSVGFIAGLPSTIMIALFFIGWSHTACAVAGAGAAVPIMGGMNRLFIITYSGFLRVNLWLGEDCSAGLLEIV